MCDSEGLMLQIIIFGMDNTKHVNLNLDFILQTDQRKENTDWQAIERDCLLPPT